MHFTIESGIYKGAAITKAIFCSFAVLVSVFSMVTLLEAKIVSSGTSRIIKGPDGEPPYDGSNFGL